MHRRRDSDPPHLSPGAPSGLALPVVWQRCFQHVRQGLVLVVYILGLWNKEQSSRLHRAGSQ